MRNALFSCSARNENNIVSSSDVASCTKKMMKKNYANNGNEKNEMNSIETDTITKSKKKES